jgi:hypothetical protein
MSLSLTVTLQEPLHATQAYAVPLDQLPLRQTRTASFQQLTDDLLTKPVNQPPSPDRWRGGEWGIVGLDPVDRLRSQRYCLERLRVRITSP